MKYIKIQSGVPLWKRLLAIACALVLTASAMATIPGGAADVKTETIAPIGDTAFDAPQTSTLSPAALLAFAIGQPLTSEEKLWLETEAGDRIPAELSLNYDCSIPHEEITVSYTAPDSITVSVSTYTGETFNTQWIPVSVTIDGEEAPLSGDGENGYHATIATQTAQPTVVTVNYEASLSPSVSAVETLLNAAYQRGEEILSAYAAYESSLSKYQAATRAYQTYRAALQQYRADLSLYNAYLSAQKDYEARKAAYEAYLDELAAYEAQLAEYQAYLSEKAAYDEAYAEYMAFVTDPTAYEKKYLAYCEYVADLAEVQNQLTLLESCFVSDSVGHVLNNTLNGPTVATVVQNQNELVAAGCDAKDIANADAATACLITLLADYPREADEGQRYAYYIRHYEEIRHNVTLLYTSLSRLYGNDLVPEILDMQGKKERYWQFVAQLYALSCALEDEVAFDISWQISGGKLTDLLESCFILTDTNRATPLSAYPAPMDEVTSPADMKKPTPPAVMEQPVAPVKVSQPTPPEAVAKPVPPTVVPAPGQKPTAPIFSACETALANAVKNGTLKNRASLVHGVTYPLTLSVDTCATPEGMITAAFYGHDRMTLWAVVSADEAGVVLFPKESPTRPSEQGTTYTFSGWMDDVGHAYPSADKSVLIRENTNFYAVYTTTKESYTVTWDVDGHITEESYYFGEIPDFKGTPVKAEDATSVYSFAGWSPAVTPVSGAVTYTAVFTAHDKFYDIQWVIGDQTETDEYLAGELPAYPTTPTLPMDGRYIYVFKGWSPEITVVEGNTVYTAMFEAVDLLGGRENAEVLSENGKVTVLFKDGASPWRWDLTHLAAYAAAQNSSLILRSQVFELSLDSESVQAVSDAAAACLLLSGTDGNGTPLTFGFYDREGNLLSLELQALMTMDVPDGQSAFVFAPSGEMISSWSDNRLSVTLSANKTYTLNIGYEIQTSVTVEGANDDKGGLCIIENRLASEGEKVNVSVTAAPGYGIGDVSIRDISGAGLTVSHEGANTYSFVMPQGGAVVTADFVPLWYTVTFKVGDQILKTEAYRYGEMPTLPENPVKNSDETHSYTFTGWSPTVTIVVSDAVYEAQFMAVPLGGEASVRESGIGFVELFAIGISAFILSCGGIVVPYVIISKKKQADVQKVGSAESEN